MNAIRARWGLEELEHAMETRTGDPLAETVVEDVGQPIVLSDPPELNARLVELLNEEGRLFTDGVTCAFRDDFRDRREGSCAACPVRHTDPADVLKPLCDVGVAQVEVLSALAVARVEADAHRDR